MATLLLVLQSIIVIIMVLVILVQKNDGNGLAGLSGGGNGLVSGRARGSFATKATIVLALVFMGNSLLIAKMAANKSSHARALIDSLDKVQSKDLEAPVAE
jgi:preprotein translocase subunit SecG